MNFRELIKVYDENYSVIKTFKKSLKDSKIIIIPFSLLLISVGVFYFTVIKDNFPNRVGWIIASILGYLISIIWSGYIQGRFIKRRYGSENEFQKHKINEVDKFIKEKLGLRSIKHYELLDSLLKKEIEICEEQKKIPLWNTIKQLFIAVLITGLLTYSFKELTTGNQQIGLSLLTLYILIIGTLLMIGALMYSLRDVGKVSKLKNISRIISELLIEISKTENEPEKKEKRGNISLENSTQTKKEIGNSKNKKDKNKRQKTKRK